MSECSCSAAQREMSEPNREAVDWPKEFDVLARYNTERMHGLLHDPAWMHRMEQLQEKYRLWVEDKYGPGAILYFNRWGAGSEDLIFTPSAQQMSDWRASEPEVKPT